MKKELYLYSGIYSFTAEDFIRQLEENKNSDITVRMDTRGGDPQAAWGMVAKMKEHKKSVTIKVDGRAYSTGSYMLPFATRVEALSTSSFVIHRAAYPDGYEKNYMTAEEREDLVQINADLRKALERKVDPTKFALMTGVTFDEIFDLSQRINVKLDAQRAKTVGLVDEINNINDSQIAASMNRIFSDDDYTNVIEAKEKEIVIVPKPLNNKIMLLAEFKEKHPDLHASIVKAAAAEEKDRVGAWMAFADVDLEAVTKGINDGAPVSSKTIAEFARKAMNATALAGVATDSAAAVTTEEQTAKASTEKEKTIEAFEAEVRSAAGLEVKK
jgi:ATP-dependent protease ClpP protease subunit